jgi:hypothetical protein
MASTVEHITIPAVAVPGPPYLSVWQRTVPHPQRADLDCVRVIGYDGRHVFFVDADADNPAWAQHYRLSYEAFSLQYDRVSDAPVCERL